MGKTAGEIRKRRETSFNCNQVQKLNAGIYHRQRVANLSFPSRCQDYTTRKIKFFKLNDNIFSITFDRVSDFGMKQSANERKMQFSNLLQFSKIWCEKFNISAQEDINLGIQMFRALVKISLKMKEKSGKYRNINQLSKRH